jgi:hypothetical protein
VTVSRAQRNYPLVLKAVSLNTGIVAAYDWAAEDGSTTADNGKDHSGNAHHWNPVGTSASIVTDAVGKGRDCSAGRTVSNRFYSAANAAALGMDRGTGDWSMFWRIRAPSTDAANPTSLRTFARICDGAGEKITLGLYEIASTGYKAHLILNNSTIVLDWSTAGNPTFAANADVIIHLTFSGGVCKAYVNGLLLKTTSGITLNLLSTTGSSNVAGNYGSATDIVLHDTTFWSRQLSDSEVSAQAANPYSYYNNSAPADSITVTAPSSSTTVGVNINISGTYAGGDNPAGIEASFNGGAYQTIVASPSGGAFSGTLTGQTPGTGTLTVRWTDQTGVLATVTNLTVSTSSIAFTTPSTQLSVKPYRLFQRDALDQATVRVSGTYTGSPTAIEYQWAGGAWTTLDASPSGGVFDKTIKLQGPGQGTFSIRFANNTAISVSVPYVSVGDLWIPAGQSQHVGMASNYVSPVAPANHTGWISIEFGKDGTWKQHIDDALHLFDDRTGATYAVQTNGTAPQGSYMGSLATRFMAAGVPVAFVPCALGSTGIADWAVSTSTSTLYGAMVARATEIGAHRGVLWWQGENEAVAGGYTQAQFATALGALPDDWFARFGTRWFLQAINSAGTGSNWQAVHDAIIQVAQTNAHVMGYADQNGAFAQLHYNTGAEIDEISRRTFVGMTAAYIGPFASSWTGGMSIGTGSVSQTIVTTAAPWTGGLQIGTGSVTQTPPLSAAPWTGGLMISTGDIAQVVTPLSAAPLTFGAVFGTGSIVMSDPAAYGQYALYQVPVVPGQAVAGALWDLTNPFKPFAIMDPDDVLHVAIDFSGWLTASDATYGTHNISAEPQLLCTDLGARQGIVALSVTANRANLPDDGQKCGLTVQCVAADGQSRSQTLYLKVKEL